MQKLYFIYNTLLFVNMSVKIIKIELALKLKKLINCIEVFFETS